MSYANMLVHECDIYHLKEKSESSGSNFGVPTEDFQKEYYYDDVPDEKGVKCYFIPRGQSVIQGDPNARITETWLVHFLASEDIRLNDKVVWDGVTYKAQKPRNIRNHHKEVIVVRDDNL